MDADLIMRVGGIVLVTHGLEAITGFGCTVMALPFVTALLGLQQGVMLLAGLSWMLSLYMTATKWRQIQWRDLGWIVLLTGLGLPFGVQAFSGISPALLKGLLGVFIVITASAQLYKALARQPAQHRLPAGVYPVLLFAGGAIHGAFASGGPLVVLYAARRLPEKGMFRATLSALWLVLNSILLVSYVRANMLDAGFASGLGWMVPFLAAGIALGEWAHSRVNERLFNRLVFGLLLGVGLVMMTVSFGPGLR